MNMIKKIVSPSYKPSHKMSRNRRIRKTANFLGCVSALLLSLCWVTPLDASENAVDPAKEQAAIAEIRANVTKNREEILKKEVAGRTTTSDKGLHVLPDALAALRLNIDVEQANEAIRKHAKDHPTSADSHPDFYPIMPIYAQIYYLFSSGSSHFPGRLTPETEAAMREQMWNYIQGTVNEALKVDEPLSIVSTENHDLRARTSLYLFSAAIKDDPAYRDRKYHGFTAAEHYARLTDFYRKNMKAKALNGIWFEVGSVQYAKYNFSALLLLADHAPDETVRQYARMLMDLAWVEHTQISYGHDRTGGKFRLAPSAVLSNPQTDISPRFTDVDKFAPLLFGETQTVNLYTIQWAASDYQVPDIAMLLYRNVGTEPAFEITNKVLSFVGREQKVGGPLVNYTYKTPHYALGGIFIDPSEEISAISSDRRWAGLIFNDAGHTRVAPFPENNGRHLDAFWHVQHKNVMVGQKFKSFRVGRMGAFIPPTPEREEADGWVFVNAGDAYAAVRPAYGGYTWDDTENWTDKASGRSAVMFFNDEWAPLILNAGDVTEFGSFANFKKRILNDSELKVTDDAVIYRGPGQPALTFYHQQLNEIRTTKNDQEALEGGTGYAGKLKLPEIDGKTVNLRPELAYQSPFLSSVPGKDIVRTSFGNHVKDYDFKQ